MKYFKIYDKIENFMKFVLIKDNNIDTIKLILFIIFYVKKKERT